MIKIRISIQNFKDINRFMRRLPFYRSFLGRFMFFEVRDSYLPITTIVHALNIKNGKQRVTYLYDTLCMLVDKFYQDKNYCQFCHNQCFIQQKIERFENGCCRRCIHLIDHRCSTQNLTCKIFQCQSIKDRYPVVSWNDFSLFACFSLRQKIILKAEYFATREEVIWDLKIGSLFVSSVFILYRFLFQTMKKKKL